MRGVVTDSSMPGGLRLADNLAEPQAGPHELVLAVRAFSINAGEASLVEQRPDGWRPGQDTAGVVVAAAADGSGPPAGTRVVAYPEWEGWAERIVVPVNWVAPIPDGVSFEQAATLPVAGLTALRAVRAGGALVGRNVLVTGATGGVGQVAVQLAVASGAQVTALVSGPEREADALELGAQLVTSSLGGSGLGPFHLVLDAVGGDVLMQAVRLAAPGAEIVLYGNRGGKAAEFALRDFYQAGAFNARVTAFISTVPEQTKGEDLAILAGLVADGRLRPRIGWTADWTRTADAFAAMARREFRGKAVLIVALYGYRGWCDG
ncbi:MAG TPA: zinc-binding dehydrogenase [Streptosporangiaceae bacterium]